MVIKYFSLTNNFTRLKLLSAIFSPEKKPNNACAIRGKSLFF